MKNFMNQKLYDNNAEYSKAKTKNINRYYKIKK